MHPMLATATCGAQELSDMREDGTVSSHRTVDRVIDILDTIAREDHAPTVSEIARAIDAPVSSTHDLVAGLVDRGWIVSDGRRLRIGSAPFVLDLLAHGDARDPVVDVDACSERFGLSVATAVRVGHHVIYTARSRNLAAEFAPLFDRHLPRTPLATAAGRLLLALAPDAARNAVLRAARRSTPALVRDYENVVSTIRRTRTAWSDGLSEQRIAAAAVLADPSDTETAIVLFADRLADRRRLRDAVDTLRA
jgi:DNA-binding IclR family transcriptional regulator